MCGNQKITEKKLHIKLSSVKVCITKFCKVPKTGEKPSALMDLYAGGGSINISSTTEVAFYLQLLLIDLEEC